MFHNNNIIIEIRLLIDHKLEGTENIHTGVHSLVLRSKEPT